MNKEQTNLLSSHAVLPSGSAATGRLPSSRPLPKVLAASPEVQKHKGQTPPFLQRQTQRRRTLPSSPSSLLQSPRVAANRNSRTCSASSSSCAFKIEDTETSASSASSPSASSPSSSLSESVPARPFPSQPLLFSYKKGLKSDRPFPWKGDPKSLRQSSSLS